MSETHLKETWAKLGDELSSVGLKLKLHFAEEFSDKEEGGDAEVNASLRRLAAAIEDIVDAVGNASKDPAVRSDLRQAGEAFNNAVSATVAEGKKRIRPTRG